MAATSRARGEGGWTLDGNQAVNCLSIGLLVCLIPRAPRPTDHYLMAALLVFTSLGFLNHLFPRRLHRLTHAVKAAYTHVLCASLATDGGWSWPVLATAVSVVDLLPWGLRSARARGRAEGLGAGVRAGLIAVGFARMGFPAWLLVVFGLLSIAYALERRQRIARGRRYDYGLAHSLEHIGVWLYLSMLNAERLDPLVAGQVAVVVLVTFAILLVLAGIGTNAWILYRLPARLPRWFDPRLRRLIFDKARSNASSHRFQHYVIKPFASTICIRRIQWTQIEQMLRRIELHERFDVVVGVLSGGGFVARYLARTRGIRRICYVRSRLWSELTLWRNLVVVLRHYLGRDNRTHVKFFGEATDLAGQRVLVVDDSVCTGVTMASVREFCQARGASRVATLALFCHPDHPTDYVFRVSKTPLVWPWGWESD